MIPGAWPETPQSTLLENISADGKARFRDATAAVSSTLGSAGLVTSAIWSDVNDDSWPDLLPLCQRWRIALWSFGRGAIKCFE